jgi:hypothetical protein
VDLLEDLLKFLILLEEKGTKNLESKGVSYAYFISVEGTTKIQLPKGEKPFVKFEDSFIDKLVSLYYFDEKLAVSSFSLKFFELLDPLIPILEQLPVVDIVSFWHLKINLDDKIEKEERVIFSILSLEHKSDFFSCLGNKLYKGIYKKLFNRDFVIHKIEIFPEPKIEETGITNYKNALFQFFLALQKEVEVIAEKEQVSLIFTWKDKLVCSYTSERRYIVLDDEFIQKGYFLALEYPEHFHSVSKQFLMDIRNGWLIKHASLELQKKYWYALTTSFFVKDNIDVSKAFFISHFVWTEYMSVGGLEFHQNGIRFSRECFKKISDREIEDFWDKIFREDLLVKMLKELEKHQ